MRIVFIIFIIINLFSSCNNENLELNLKDDSLIMKYFNDSEISELNSILLFVDSIIQVDRNNINDSYHFYFDSIYTVSKIEGIEVLSLEEDMKYSFLFNLDTLLFNQVWRKDTISELVRAKDTTIYNAVGLINIDLNSNGKYVLMLSELSKSDINFKEISEVIQLSGTITPSLIIGFMKNNNKFDFNKIQNRLWAAIFLLSLEETVDKKVERYLMLSRMDGDLQL